MRDGLAVLTSDGEPITPRVLQEPDPEPESRAVTVIQASFFRSDLHTWRFDLAANAVLDVRGATGHEGTCAVWRARDRVAHSSLGQAMSQADRNLLCAR